MLLRQGVRDRVSKAVTRKAPHRTQKTRGARREGAEFRGAGWSE